MKRIICFLVCLNLLLFCFCADAFADTSMSWYCKRNKEHKQPTLDSDMSFIEDYGGYYIDKSHGDNSSEKVIYLTFDAGYENGNVEKILDVMKKEGVCGAFFVLGNLITKNTELVKRMVDEGHLVCNHTRSHRDMTKISEIDEFSAELASLEALYSEYIGGEMAKFYRPPEGRFSRTSMDYANRLGYKTIFWSFAYADWDNGKQMSCEEAKKKIFDNIHNGAVLLLHPTSATNAAILGDVICQLRSEGYRFGDLYELTGVGK
ncbi:MAG: delta-lactam-biosynthetic de-N-acetylase [Ruminococcaceae bacterium]|nr:delta-lactam-biosynthetic de-N-acetylase [Oscillospiraceae bacterium]